MHAIIQWLESVMAAVAVAAFAHFGVALKDAPCPRADQPVHRIRIASALPARNASVAAPRALASGLRRA